MPEQFCNAKRTKAGKDKDGKVKRCKREAGWGTNHVGYGTCKLHGGSTPNAVKAAAKKRLLEETAIYGEPRDVEPGEALLEELHRTAGIVAWLQMKVGTFDKDGQLTQFVGGSDEGGLPKEEAGVWVKLYQEERGHMARVAKTCVDVGIDERRVRIAEGQGRMLAQVISGVLADLNITIDQRVREVVRNQLMAIDGSARELTTSGNGASG